MDELCTVLVEKYDASLKAEHGTGRNMAPFVELEWGSQAYGLMKEIKQLFDPAGLLNPGVIINDDPAAHLKHLKPMPAAGQLYAPVDRCIECGFCEPQCPSHGLTLSPRQRIVGWRELSRRQAAGEAPGQLGEDYLYMGLDTCATCGLCSTACPVGIETGALTRAVRGEQLSAWPAASAGGRQPLRRHPGAGPHRPQGRPPGRSHRRPQGLARLSGGAWKEGMPKPQPLRYDITRSSGDKVVYFPTCAGRMFGADTPEHALSATVIRVLERAGYAPIVPDGEQPVLRPVLRQQGPRRGRRPQVGRARSRADEGQQQRRIPGDPRRQRLQPAHEDLPRRAPQGTTSSSLPTTPCCRA
jgi:D-lactate dehydrogenase